MKVEAPVPPLATVRSLVKVRVSIVALVAVKNVAKRLVEVAFVEVEKVAKVEEAINPRGEPVSQRPVEVETTF